MSICGGGKPQLAKNARTLCPSSPHLKPTEGVKIRPNLMCNDEVFLELANRALVNARAFEPPGDRLDANAERGSRACLVWKWPPQYRRLPPKQWQGLPRGDMLELRPRVRLRGKRSPDGGSQGLFMLA